MRRPFQIDGKRFCMENVLVMSALDVFDDVSLETLRSRRSEKWTKYPGNILPAFVAEMDFALAPAVRDALQTAVEAGDCGYASSVGLARAFCGFVQHRFDWNVEDDRVFGVPDVMAGVTETLCALTDPGAAIAISPPVYPPFFEAISTNDRIVYEVPLEQSGCHVWSMDFDALEAAFANGVQAYLLCSPHNPVGRVWSASELTRLATLARAYGVAIVADEIHAPLCMPGVEFVPFLSIVPAGQRCAAVWSASKAWNIAGLKCALLIAGSTEVHKVLAGRLSAIPTQIRDRIGHFGAIASVAAFRHGCGWLDALRTYLDGNRQLLSQLLRDKLPQAVYHEPQATYLAWVDCRKLGLGPDPATHFLRRGRLAVEPGIKFGAQGEGCVRLNFGTSRAILTEAVSRMSASI